MAEFNFNPNAAPDENVLTAQELVEAPLDQWDSILEEGRVPNDMATFQHNLEQAVRNSEGLIRGSTGGNIEWIADGRMDPYIANYGGIENFTEKHPRGLDSRITLPGFQDLAQDVYEKAYQVRQMCPPEDYPRQANGAHHPTVREGIDAVNKYRDESVEELSGQYRTKIQEVIQKLTAPEPAPEAAPDAAPDTVTPEAEIIEPSGAAIVGATAPRP